MQRSAPQTPLIDNNNQTNQRSNNPIITSNEAISTSQSPVNNKSSLFLSSVMRSDSPNDIRLNRLSSDGVFNKTAHRSVSMNFNTTACGCSNQNSSPSSTHITEIITSDSVR